MQILPYQSDVWSEVEFSSGGYAVPLSKLVIKFTKDFSNFNMVIRDITMETCIPPGKCLVLIRFSFLLSAEVISDNHKYVRIELQPVQCSSSLLKLFLT
jgi:hypothetical protein